MKGPFKRGAVYHYDFVADGQRYQGSTGLKNEREAQKYVDALRTRIALGEVGLGTTVEVPTFREFKLLFEKMVQHEVRSPKTRQFYMACYAKMLDWPKWADLPLNQLDEPLINSFRHWALSKVGKTRIDRYMATLKRALRHAHLDLRIISRVPLIKFYAVKSGREHIFTNEEYKQWLGAAPEPLRSMSVLAHDRGICRNEMLALQKDCVQLLNRPDELQSWGTINIKRGLKRDARARLLTLTKEMRDVLAARMKDSKCPHVFVSLTDPKEPLSEYTIGAQVTALKEAIGAHPESGLHLLRHTFLTRAGDKIKNVKTLMLIAGHSNPATSMKYIHPQQDDIANALASCDELAKKKPEEGQRCTTCGQVFREGKQSLQFSLQSPSSKVEEILASS